MSPMQTFAVATSELATTLLIEQPLPVPAEGELLLKVDRFAFTANNITYAETGDSIGYWRFFPAPQERPQGGAASSPPPEGGLDARGGPAVRGGWGVVPVWGFADVLASRHEAFAPGERVYGFWPMATHSTLAPQRVGPAGFMDASAHRTALPPAYNRYQRCAGDTGYRPEWEGWQALLRPMFLTSFLIDDFLADEGFFGARRVVLSSASAKTAFGLAHLLHRRGTVEVVGLTSPAHHAFVRGLGCYDRVLSYDELERLDPACPSVYVDFAGSAALRMRLHSFFGEALRFSSAVGLAHRDLQRREGELPGPKPIFFFAPDRLRQRAQDWGRDGIEPRVAERWQAFVQAAQGWLTLHEGAGPAAVEAVYRQTLDGRVPPHEGHLLSMHGR